MSAILETAVWRKQKREERISWIDIVDNIKDLFWKITFNW